MYTSTWFNGRIMEKHGLSKETRYKLQKTHKEGPIERATFRNQKYIENISYCCEFGINLYFSWNVKSYASSSLNKLAFIFISIYLLALNATAHYNGQASSQWLARLDLLWKKAIKHNLKETFIFIFLMRLFFCPKHCWLTKLHWFLLSPTTFLLYVQGDATWFWYQLLAKHIHYWISTISASSDNI